MRRNEPNDKAEAQKRPAQEESALETTAQETTAQETMAHEVGNQGLGGVMMPMSKALTPCDVEQLEEIIIRAHYLSMELRDMCAPSGVGQIAMSEMAGLMLKGWALAFSQQLERTMAASHSSC